MAAKTFFGKGLSPLGSGDFWGNAGASLMKRALSGWTIGKQDSNKGVTYVAPKLYDNYFVFVAKTRASLIAHQQLNMMFPKYQQWIKDKKLAEIAEQRAKINQKIIEAGEEVNKGYGEILGAGAKKILARDCYGGTDNTKDALFLSYLGNETIAYKENDNGKESFIYTTTVYWYDIVPQITAKSARNLVCTTVQGRDYTRKELIGNGDIVFTVRGEINSHIPGVYPSDKVKRFINIMQHNGIIDVNNLIFGQFNVEKILIKDYSLDTPQYKNIQPYTFTCVAVEPDEVTVASDTISFIDYQIQQNSEMKWWEKLILGEGDEWWAKIGGAAVSGLASITAGAIGSGFNALIDNLDDNEFQENE